MTATRRRPVGAELIGDGVDFRVWAPDRKSVSVVIDGSDFPLELENDGHFRGFVEEARAGTRYRFRLDRDEETFPDPASRFQPEGPHGPSMVVDPAYPWRDRTWRGVNPRALVIYEMHIGTFSREGTWRSAIDHLHSLADLGINLVEVMPVNEFAGRFGWGYDGVDLWAPTHLYGTPDDFRLFVDSAHALGVGVILDVVYNHFGPDGCYWKSFAKDYFLERKNEWGDAINFGASGVRELVAENAGYWIEEFHLDGLRLDATQNIDDRCPEHIIAVIQRKAREAARDRAIVIVAENEPQDVVLLESYGVDAMWNDDWHHSAMVAATGQHEAYYTDYRGRPQEFVSMAKHGFLYQGQWYSWQKNNRGTPSRDIARERFVCFLQNHDQIANSGTGERIQFRTSPGRTRALTALLLLGPNTPMLFQGQEFAASAPFLYFADHKPELAHAVEKGRREFMSQFPSIAIEKLPAPHDPSTFERCKLDHSEREKHSDAIALHRDLLRLRRPTDRVDGAVIGEHALLLRFDDDRLLIVNLGPALTLDIMPEPLLAPPAGHRWELRWSSEPAALWRIPGESALLLEAVRHTRS
ncbi:MAG: malto-oligosyltrehalose trehalohydrolase [Acidobacteriota bacterium]|nr:malto-oligosyltrehalose trehalohydrolase [Acidobacteriota bacterium]